VFGFSHVFGLKPRTARSPVHGAPTGGEIVDGCALVYVTRRERRAYTAPRKAPFTGLKAICNLDTDGTLSGSWDGFASARCRMQAAHLD
jgi:hypothetical protein